MHVTVEGLSKSFGRFPAVKDVHFQIRQGQLVGLLGPSGSGKTTVLRMLAGLETPDAGDIRFHGQRVNHLLPQERGIGLVFQNYALFRHMTVFENIAFGLKVQKRGKEEIKRRVEELLERTGLSGLAHRLPHQLSGGQRQRVAFARALAPEPQLLLLDEPFAAIDAKVRKELRAWLKSMIREVGITSIFVTHDQEEAVEVADEIIIMNQGKVEQQGTPIDIYRNPETVFVAGFIGESTVIENDGGWKGFENPLPGSKALVRPENVEIGTDKDISLPNAAEKGTVKDVIFRGANWLVVVEARGSTITGYRPLDKELLKPGDEVLVLIHRLYEFNDQGMQVRENGAKIDPMPIYI
jgi:sulfate transport system ATP-binding protein